jgi:predicted phosphodiesterase
MHTPTKTFDGILFIGDPHVSSKKIGRRKDDYLSSVLGKIEACATICNEKNLYPVFLGDLLHTWHDNSLRMLNRLTRALKKFDTTPVTLEGNHDKGKTHLDEDDALSLLLVSGTIDVIVDAGEFCRLNVRGAPVRLWGCPHGNDIPRELPEFEGNTILVTHHDLAFSSSYIGSLPLTEVLNCETVVNGHMHDTKPAVQVGNTWWINPGNIEPLSIDLIEHIPRAWSWHPENSPGLLNAHDLPHGVDLFDLTGTIVAAEDSDTAVAALLSAGISEPSQSKFAQLIRAQNESEAQKTDDASVLQEDLELVLGASGVSDAAKALMQGLFQSLRGPTSPA